MADMTPAYLGGTLALTDTPVVLIRLPLLADTGTAGTGNLPPNGGAENPSAARRQPHLRCLLWKQAPKEWQ